MRAEIINSISDALRSVMFDNGGFFLEHNCNKVLHSKRVYKEVVLEIELFGGSSIHGDIMVIMNEHVALKLISFMMGGLEVKEIDNIGISALSEYGNWVTAAIAKRVQDYGEIITNFKNDVGYKELETTLFPKGEAPFLSLTYLMDNNEIELMISIHK